jgi:hypothetical protein
LISSADCGIILKPHLAFTPSVSPAANQYRY